MQAVQQVSLPTWKNLMERGGISLRTHHTHCLFKVRVKDDNFTQVEEEEAVAGGLREAHLQAITQRQSFPPSTEKHTSHDTHTLIRHASGLTEDRLLRSVSAEVWGLPFGVWIR